MGSKKKKISEQQVPEIQVIIGMDTQVKNRNVSGAISSD